jgi:hypothetical protein
LRIADFKKLELLKSAIQPSQVHKSAIRNPQSEIPFRNPQFEILISSHEQSRYQLCSSPHSKLDEDVAQMELHSLLGNLEATANLGIGQSFHAAKCNLCFSAAQVSMLYDPGYGALKRMVQLSTFNSYKPLLAASGNHLFRWEDAISSARFASPALVSLLCALNTQFREQAFQAAPDRAQADSSEGHQPASGQECGRLCVFINCKDHRSIEPMLNWSVAQGHQGHSRLAREMFAVLA